MRLQQASALAGGFLLASVCASAQTPAEWQDVIRNLRHPDGQIRLRAIEQLTDARYTTAAEPVSALLLDEDDQIQAAAIEAELTFFLADRIGGFRLLTLGNSKSRAQLAFEAGPLARGAMPAPPAVIDRLIEAIRDENPRVRFDAVHAVGFIAERPLESDRVLALAAELDHYDPIVRAATARVLGHLQAREAADALLVALGDSSELVRQFAFEALGRIGAPAVLDRARDAAARDEGDIAEAAFQALGRVGATADISLFRERLTGSRAFTRRVAAEGLGRAGDRDSIGALQQMAETERADDVRLAAIFALQMLGQNRVEAIAAGLAYDEGKQAEEYLFEIGPAAIAELRSALDSAAESDLRTRLTQLVGYLGTAADIARLEPLLAGEDDRVRTAATAAIQRLRRQ